MSLEIQILNGQKEYSFPIIRVTKSLTGETGTASFLFIQPNFFQSFFNQKKEVEFISLIYDEKKIQTKDITVYYKEGKPFLLKAIFIFKNSIEWFEFLKFMTEYAKEKGFLFESEKFY